MPPRVSLAFRQAIENATSDQLRDIVLRVCKRNQEAKQIAEEVLFRYLQCQRCQVVFEAEKNRLGACVYHEDARKIVNPAAAVWQSHVAALHGIPKTLVDDPLYARGFMWACCKQPLSNEGCQRKKHEAYDVPLAAGEFIDQRRSCRPVSLRETTMLRGYAGATGGFGPEVMKTYKVPLEESELFKSAQRRAAQGAGHMSGHFREIKLEDGAYHTREEDNIETEITMGEVGELGPSQKKVKLEDNAYIKSEEGGVAGGFEHPQKRFKREDGNYLGREEGGSVDTVMGEVGESGQSRKKIKLEDGTYIKREEGVETAYADDGRRRRNSRVPRRPGMTPRTKEAKFEDSPCVKRKEGF